MARPESRGNMPRRSNVSPKRKATRRFAQAFVYKIEIMPICYFDNKTRCNCSCRCGYKPHHRGRCRLVRLQTAPTNAQNQIGIRSNTCDSVSISALSDREVVQAFSDDGAMDLDVFQYPLFRIVKWCYHCCPADAASRLVSISALSDREVVPLML